MGEMLETTIEVKLDKVPKGFDLGERVLGDSDENVTYIKNETDATIQTLLKGPSRSTINLIIRHKDMDVLKKTEDLIHSLIATVKEDYEDFLAEQPPFIKSRYKVDDLKCTQTYVCRPKCDMTFENLQTYTHHLSSQWHLVNTSKNVSKAQPKGPAPGQGERKEFVGTVTDVKGHFVVISDSIICDTRILPGQVKFQVGDRVKGVQVPSTHPNYKWKAVSVSMLSINKNPTSLLGDAPAPTLSRNTQRKHLFEQQLLKAFSFFLNEQTTPRALWNTHHMVQSQAKTRPIQRPLMMQSPTFCALCNMNVLPASLMPGHLGSNAHRIKYVEKQLELGLERFPVMYGTVPLTGVVTNNGKRLAVDALVQFFGGDLPSHNADAFKSMILLNGALKNLYCEICQQSLVRYDVWIQHMVGKQHATKCVQVMATRGLRAYLQQYPSAPAPAPRKMKEAIKVMAEHLLKNAHQLQEYAIETETVPELDNVPEQPATQGNKPGLLGDAPLGLAPSGFEGGPDPQPDVGVGNKRKNQGDNIHPQKKAKAGLLGSAPVGFEILDEGGEWEGGYAEETPGKEEWVGPAQEEWDAPPGFKLKGKGPLTAWDLPEEDEGGEYVGGFSSSNGTNMLGRRGGNPSAGKLAAMRTRPGKAPPSLLDIDTGREWDSPERGEFVGGGGDDSFVGGGDPKFLPPGVTRDTAANILQAAQGLMSTMHSPVGSVGRQFPQRGPQPGVSQPEMVALQALSNNIRSLVNTLQTRQAMHPQMLMSRLTPQDLQFLREVRSRTGIDNIPLLIRLVQTVRSLPANVFDTLSKLNPAVLLSNLAGGSSPQQKMIVKQIMMLLGTQTLDMQPNQMQRGASHLRPGLLGEHPMAIMRRQLSGGVGVPSLLDMPVTFRSKRGGHLPAKPNKTVT